MLPNEIEFLLTQQIEVKEQISHGNYGTIFDVFSNKYNERFALKRILKDKFKIEEIECIKHLDDIRVIRIYDYFEFGSYIYILMEFCKTDLQAVIRSSKYISRKDLHRYIFDIVSAVKACHDRGIAHCDIKPSNFLLDKHGRVKISDFGLSDICSLSPRSAECKGTPLFMAPEILKGQLYNPMKADIWALGITIYFLATGTLPFINSSIYKLIETICEGVYSDGIIDDPLLRMLISRCIDCNISSRATADELLKMPYFQQFEIKARKFMPITKNKTLIGSMKSNAMDIRRHSRISIPKILDICKLPKL